MRCGAAADRGPAWFYALLKRSGLPELTFAAFQAAIEVGQETGFADLPSGAARLRRRMVERVLRTARPIITRSAQAS